MCGCRELPCQTKVAGKQFDLGTFAICDRIVGIEALSFAAVSKRTGAISNEAFDTAAQSQDRLAIRIRSRERPS